LIRGDLERFFVPFRLPRRDMRLAKRCQHETSTPPMTVEHGPMQCGQIMIFLFVSDKGNFYSILTAPRSAALLNACVLITESGARRNNDKTEKGYAIRQAVRERSADWQTFGRHQVGAEPRRPKPGDFQPL
jgi:hypothetical protein